MDIKETLFRSELQTTLVNNEDYFKYIFKKTEKIVCAVLYTTRTNTDIRQNDLLISDLETSVIALMNTAQATLQATSGQRVRSLNALRAALITLESKLTMIAAAGLLSHELLDVFKQELFGLGRALKRYLEAEGQVHDDTPLPLKEPKRQTYRKDKSQSEGISHTQGVPVENRRTRILQVIKDKNNATIKDISEVVSDCSEKTVQRELIDLIKDGIIVREGERRWSKYRLV